MRKKKQLVPLSEGPSAFRRQHTAFTQEVLTPQGAPVISRHRARTILTPLGVRLAILEEVSARPESVRVRSLRRRLTALDRALTDRQAEMLERLTSCINSLSNIGCLNYLSSEVRASPYGRIPFSESKRREIAAMTYVLKKLNAADRSAVLELAALLDPARSLAAAKPDEPFIAAVCSAAGAVVSFYEEYFRQVSPQGRCN